MAFTQGNLGGCHSDFGKSDNGYEGGCDPVTGHCGGPYELYPSIESNESSFDKEWALQVAGMVARYTCALSGERAVEEFRRSWKELSFLRI